MKTVQQLIEKWDSVLNVAGVAPITDRARLETTAVLLENTQNAIQEERQRRLDESAPLTQTQGYPTDGTGMAKFDPVLISMVRRSAPKLIAYDIMGVQPLRAPTGLIFALKARYGNQSGPEALFGEVNTGFSGTGTHAGSDPTADFVDQDPVAAGNQFGTYTTGTGMSTQAMEQLGSGAPGTAFGEMSFTIEQMMVEAKGRALKTGFSTEFATDLKNVHGLDADTELSNILSTALISDVNREALRSMYAAAKVGAQDATKAGVFDLLVDSDGRWLAERHKGLMFQIEREANAIAQETKMGKGNILVCSADIASALSLAGVLDYAPALQSTLSVNPAGSTFAGVIKATGMKVYVDPYSGVAGGANQFFMVAYKGESAWDAGMFYSPYVPLQIVRGQDPNTLSPILGYKQRYAISKHPFFNQSGRVNAYMRIAAVRNVI